MESNRNKFPEEGIKLRRSTEQNSIEDVTNTEAKTKQVRVVKYSQEQHLTEEWNGKAELHFCLFNLVDARLKISLRAAGTGRLLKQPN